MRKGPLVGAMIPSPGAMRTFKQLAKAPPEPVEPEPEVQVVAPGTNKNTLLWIVIAVVVAIGLAFIVTR
jgi:hypothetical protein